MGQIKQSLQEVPTIGEIEQQLKRLSRRRRQLVEEKVAIQNRMQADLQAVCPGFLDIVKKVDSLYVLRFLTCRPNLRQLARLKPTTVLSIPGIGAAKARILAQWQHSAIFGPDVDLAGPMIIEDAKRILELKARIEALEDQLAALVEQSSLSKLLMTIPGFGVVCAAEVAGEIGTIERFKSADGLALYLGMAPLDNSSGKQKGTKSPRQVNKRAKAAMMVVLGQHIRVVNESKEYYTKKRSEGKSYNQALRSLGRHLVRIIWKMLKTGRPYEIKHNTTIAA